MKKRIIIVIAIIILIIIVIVGYLLIFRNNNQYSCGSSSLTSNLPNNLGNFHKIKSTDISCLNLEKQIKGGLPKMTNYGSIIYRTSTGGNYTIDIVEFSNVKDALDGEHNLIDEIPNNLQSITQGFGNNKVTFLIKQYGVISTFWKSKNHIIIINNYGNNNIDIDLINKLISKYPSDNDILLYKDKQLQNAMQWVKDQTPKTANFANFWDYSYWIKSIGERTTITEYKNEINSPTEWIKNVIITGSNQSESLKLLYNNNASYLLLDSNDIEKDPIGKFLIDQNQIQETKDQTIMVYTGMISLDEDIVSYDNGKEIFLPGQKTEIGLIKLTTLKNNNGTQFIQPYAIMQYKNMNYKINIRYLYVDGRFIDFKNGIEGCMYVFPEIITDNQGRVNVNKIGAALFLTPRLMRGYIAQKYILDDPFNKYPNFKLVHTETNVIIDTLNNQGMNLPDFIYFQGIQGPTKIWKIDYD